MSFMGTHHLGFRSGYARRGGRSRTVCAAWLTLIMWAAVWLLPGVHAVLSHGGMGDGLCEDPRARHVEALPHDHEWNHSEDRGAIAGHSQGPIRAGRDVLPERPARHQHREGGDDCSTCVLLACLISPAGPPRECAMIGTHVGVAAVGDASQCVEWNSLPEGLLRHGPPVRGAFGVA